MDNTIIVGIPCYKSLENLRVSLSSLRCQTIRESISVVLGFDGDPWEEETRKWVMDNFKNDFKEIIFISHEENQGPAGGRNLILEYVYKNSDKYDYLMFLDADDALYSVMTLQTIKNKVDTEEIDILTGTMFEQTAYFAEVHEPNNAIWVHGEVFKISFLKFIEAEFPLCTNEDVAFNSYIRKFTTQIVEDNIPYYCWFDNRQSTVRQTEGEYYKHLTQGLINGVLFCYKKILHREGVDFAKHYLLDIIPALYFIGCGLWCKVTDMDVGAREAMHNLLVETKIKDILSEEESIAKISERFALPQNSHFLLDGYPILSLHEWARIYSDDNIWRMKNNA